MPLTALLLAAGFRGLGGVSETNGGLAVLRALDLCTRGGGLAAGRLVGLARILVIPLLTDEHAMVEHDLALRAAGFGADGQGIVLAPPAFTAQYLPVRRFLAMALGLAKQRCASYHIWAALPLTPTPDGEELCAQYLASGLTLRAVVPLDSQQLLVFAAHTPVGRGSTVRRVHLQDPALPRLLERGGAVADFGWDKQGLVLSVRRME